MSTLVTYETKDDHIGMITINRPTAANALSVGLLNELNDVITRINHSPKVNVVIITGAGEKVFCAGADLKERKEMTTTEVIQTVNYIGQTITNIENMQIPVIAAINGAAFGGGLELALACDIRIAAAHSRVGLTETSLAIIPGAGGTQRLARLIGIGQAKRLIYTANAIDAREALTIGLVEEIAQTNVLKYALKMAANIAKNGPIALKLAKRAINEGLQTDLTSGLEMEHKLYLKTIETEDRVEGLLAFSEKRTPKYQGK